MKSALVSFVLLFAAVCGAQKLSNPVRQMLFRAGYDNGPALVDLQLKDQHRLFGLPTSGIFQYVIWQCDGGASTFQLATRRSGSVRVITPLMTPATVGTVSGTIACASWDGSSHIWEGNSIPCSKTGSFGFAAGDTLETTDSPAADGVSKSCTAYISVQ